jgi:hypothetical protein
VDVDLTYGLSPMTVAVGVPSVEGMKRVLAILGVLLGVYLMARAVAWPFSVDPGDAATYANDWGGPSLLGVAAVHCGPGLIAAGVLTAVVVRGRRAARRAMGQDGGGAPNS